MTHALEARSLVRRFCIHKPGGPHLIVGDVQNNPISNAANSIICKLNIYPWRARVWRQSARQQSLFSGALYFSFTGSRAQPERTAARSTALAFILVCGAQSHPFRPPNKPAIHPSIRVLQLQYRSLGSARGVCCALAFVQLQCVYIGISLLALLVTQSPRFAAASQDEPMRRHGLHGKRLKSCVDMFMHCSIKTRGLFGSSTDFLLVFGFGSKILLPLRGKLEVNDVFGRETTKLCKDLYLKIKQQKFELFII